MSVGTPVPYPFALSAVEAAVAYGSQAACTSTAPGANGMLGEPGR